VTPEEFITALFGKGWTEAQLPLFLVMVQKFNEDSKRYHEIRELLTNRSGAIATREELNEFDDLVDEAARYAGIV
jgi:hypothetical protein